MANARPRIGRSLVSKQSHAVGGGALSRGSCFASREPGYTRRTSQRRHVAEAAVRKIRALTSYTERRRAIEEIIDRTNPGPGGFYDNLGSLSCQRHLVCGVGALKDPEFRASALLGHRHPEWSGAAVPMAWKRWAESLYDAPLE